MTAEEVLKYIQLASRKTYILTHNGVEWLPEYEEELQELVFTRIHTLSHGAKLH